MYLYPTPSPSGILKPQTTRSRDLTGERQQPSSRSVATPDAELVWSPMGGTLDSSLEGDQKAPESNPGFLSSVETTSSPWHSVHVAHIGMIFHLKPVRSKCNDAAQDRSSTRKENRID